MKGLIFTYFMTYGGAAVALFRPFTGLLIYVCFAILKPDMMWYWSVPAGNYSRIVAVALVVGWALHEFGNWSFGKGLPIILVLLGYWSWIGISAALAPDSNIASAAFELQSKILLPCLVACTLLRSREQLKQLLWVILLSQGYIALEMNLSYLSNGAAFIRRFREMGFGGMDNNSVAIAMVAGSGAAFMLALSVRKRWQKVIFAVAMVLMAHTVLLGLTRGGMLGLIAMGIAAFIVLPKRWSYYCGMLAGAAVLLFLAGPMVQDRFSTLFVSREELDSSASGRLDLWRSCLDLMWKNPIFGAGPDHWQRMAHLYGFTEGKSAHTLWLKVAAELGVPGFFFLTTFYGLCLLRLWGLTRDKQATHDPELIDLARVVIVALAGFAVSAQFVALDRLELPYFLNVVGIGVLRLASSQRDRYPELYRFALEQTHPAMCAVAPAPRS